MARPEKKDIVSGLEAWDAEADDNFEITFNTPFPPALYANAAALPSAALYEGCIAWVEDVELLYISSGGAWESLTEVAHYSETEQDSGRRWIDGAVIYVKTIDFGALPNATTKNVAHSISGLGLVIKLEGVASNGTTQYPLPIDQKVAANHVVLLANATNIQMDTNFNWAAYDGWVYIYYTKA